MLKIAVGIVVLVLLAVGAAVALRLRAGRDTSATQPTTAKAPGKVAIVYYSQSKVRNTALIAKWIQKHLGGDLIEIETVEPYPEPYTLTLAAAEKERRSGPSSQYLRWRLTMWCSLALQSGTGRTRFPLSSS